MRKRRKESMRRMTVMEIPCRMSPRRLKRRDLALT
jgi:hypothetical protein